MSNLPPPPPSSLPASVPPPPPPVNHPAGPAWAQPPPSQLPPLSMPSGYVAYGQQNLGDVQTSGGLRNATVALFWTTTAATGLLAFTLFSRKAKWDEFVDSDRRFADLQLLEDADNLVTLAVVVQATMYIASAILVCLWSRRIVLNARARGVPGLNPGLAAGGWFIPIGFFWVGFDQLRKAVSGMQANAADLRRWQAAFVVMGVSSFVLRRFNADYSVGDSAGDVASKLNIQGVIGVVSLALFAIAALFATRATKEVDRAVTG